MSGYTGQVPDTLPRADDWSQHGLCRSEDPEDFFKAAQEQYAKSICLRCPVLVSCQREVMAVESGQSEEVRWGVVAGLTAAERAALDPIAEERKARREAQLRKKAKQSADKAAAVTTEAAPPALEPTRKVQSAKPKGPPPAPKAAPEAAPGKAAAGKRRGGRPRAKCPSNGAYQRHVMLGEPIDDGCREAHARANLLSRYAGEERRVWLHWSKAKADEDIAAATGLSVRTVRRVRARLGLIANEPKDGG
ncbi:WhiB family transcriptional regulator [Streptomyces sp. NPDC054802]